MSKKQTEAALKLTVHEQQTNDARMRQLNLEIIRLEDEQRKLLAVSETLKARNDAIVQRLHEVKQDLRHLLAN